MGQAAPGHVGDVQQAIDSAQVHERAVLGEVLHHSGQHRAFFQVLQSFGFLFVLFLFHQLLARNDDVAALLVELDDGDFDGLALEDIQITHRPQVGLRSWQESLGAQNVDRESALDTLDHRCLDRLLLVMRLLNLVPGAQTLRLLVGEVDVPFLGLALVAHDGDFVAGLEAGLARVVHHFGDRKHALGFGANVHDDMRGSDLQHGALDDVVFAGGFFGLGGEGLESGGEVFGG